MVLGDYFFLRMFDFVEIPYWAGTSLCSSLPFVIANILNTKERISCDTLFLFTQVSYICRGIFYLVIL